jgi:hypothetical protein
VGRITSVIYLNVHKATDIRQIEICLAEMLVPEPSSSEVENAIGKLKKYTLRFMD